MTAVDAHNPAAQDFALAIDIGGTKAAFAFVDSTGRQLTPTEKHPVPFDSQDIAEPQGLIDIIRPGPSAC